MKNNLFGEKVSYPDWAIERFTRCIFDDVLAFFATEEGQAEYEAWEKEQAQLKQNKKRAALDGAALVVYWGFFFLGPRGFDSGRISQPLAKYVCS